MSKARLIIISIAMLGIAILAFIWVQKNEDKNSVASGKEVQENSLAESRSMASDRAGASRKAEFSLETSSLRGTEVDGGLSFDANGQVLLDLGLRHLFDYYLSLVGERNIVQIRVLLKDYLLSKYSAANSDQALHYFDRYTDYLNALSDSNIAALTNPQERLDRVTVLRKKILGDEMALAFFADEDALAALTLKRLAITNDKTLSAEEKARLLAELDKSANYTARTEADTAALIAEQNSQLDALNLTDAQRAAERETLWGKEAAGRLTQLDQQRGQWDARVDQYLQACKRIDANRTLSATARAQAIAALRAQQFNAVEQRRIASLEAIGQLKPGG